MATPTAAEEVASLDRVLTRLALTEESNLEKVLSKLVPAVIEALKSPHAATRQKVLEMLSHVNKRLQGSTTLKLPLEQLVYLYLKPTSSPMTRNFALVYIETAFKRASAEDRLAVVPKLLSGVADRSTQHRDILLRLAVSGLSALAKLPHQIGTPAEFAARYPFLNNEGDRRTFLDFAAKVLLYQPPSRGRLPAGGAPARMAQVDFVAQQHAISSGQAPPASGTAGGLLQPPHPEPPGPAAGLSRYEVSRIIGKEAPTGEVLVTMKLGILNFTTAADVSPGDAVIHYLIAACDPNDAVSRQGDELIRKRCGLDSPKPTVDLEDPVLVSKLFYLFHGTPADSTLAEENKVSKAAPALQARLMLLFSKSIAAANCFPATFEAIFSCVYGEGTTVRLKQAGMEFAVWVFKHASDEQLLPAAPKILDALLSLLDEEGAASGSDSAAQRLRGFTYQAVGQLGGRAPEVMRAQGGVPHRLFQALGSEAPGVRASLQEAINSLSIAYKGSKGEAAAEIQRLLLDSIVSPQEGVRYCAVTWAVRLFPFTDVAARYICGVAAGDSKLEVKEAGVGGLKAPTIPQSQGAGTPEADANFPVLQDMLSFLQQRHPRLRRLPRAGDSLVLEPKSLLALINFLQSCWKQGLSAELEQMHEAGASDGYLDFLEHSLLRDGTSELHVAAMQAMLEVAAEDTVAFAHRYTSRISFLRSFLSHTDDEVRDVAGKLLGIVAGSLDLPRAAELLQQLSGGIMTESKGQASKFEERGGSIAATGYLLAQCGTGVPLVPEDDQASATKALAAALADPTPALAATAAAALGHAGLRRPLPLAEGEPPTGPSVTETSDSSSRARRESDAPSGSNVEPSAQPTGSTSQPTETGTASINGDAESGVTRESKPDGPPESKPDGPPETRQAVVAGFTALTRGRDVKAATRAATALGHLAVGETSPAVLDAITSALMDLSANKADALQFAVGEALCFAFGGVSITPDTILHSSFRSLASWLTAVNNLSPDAAADSSVAMTVDDEISDNAPMERTALRDRILAKILDDFIYHSRAEVRTAACVWLVSLVSFTGKSHALMARLAAVQEAFGYLLGDSSELIQEMASKGISAVYRLGSDDDRKQLLSALMSTLQGGARKRRAVKVTGDTRVFEEGQLGEAPGGGSLSTYRELSSLATEMGQPDLLYKFMDLANHAAVLNSSRGAAFGVASIAKMAGEQMEPYIAQLVPKLYRYQYDPNRRVRDGMANIWRALIPEPRKAVDQHFKTIMAELLREMGGKLWRNREAACLAMADLLQGRRWSEVQSHLEQIWTMTLRALDDIKESVRTAAAGLVRTLRGLTLRLTDPAHSPEGEASAALALTLPFLLKTGMASQVAEVQGLALTTVAKMVEQAGPVQLRPHLPDLTTAMLESLSGMEDSRINYVEQHAERLGLDSDKLENLRVSAAKSSPMGDTLDFCARYTDATTLEALVPRLSQLVRRGVGLNTRVGTARFIGSLATRIGSEIRPHTGVLIKALVGAAKGERSGGVRRAYATAAAQVAKFAPEPRVAKLVADAVELFQDPGDQPSRHLAGLLARELARQALDAFAAHAVQVMPLAFLARSDEDSEVAALWADIWGDSSSSEAASLRLYMDDILALLSQGLASQQWGRKKAAAKAIVSLSEAGAEPLQPHAASLTSALLQELPGRIWDGKESVLEAIAALCKAAPKQLASSGRGAEAVTALVTAIGRPKAAYRNAALSALEIVLTHLEEDFYSQVGPLLHDAAEAAHKAASGPSVKASKVDEEKAEDAPKPLPLLDTVKCLTAAWKAAQPRTRTSWGEKHVASLSLALNPGHPWTVRVAALSACEGVAASNSGQHAADGPSQPAVAAWMTSLLLGILAATEDQRISQVRQAALDALAAALSASQDDLEQSILESVRQRLDGFVTSEKNAALKAKAVGIRVGLPR